MRTAIVTGASRGLGLEPPAPSQTAAGVWSSTPAAQPQPRSRARRADRDDRRHRDRRRRRRPGPSRPPRGGRGRTIDLLVTTRARSGRRRCRRSPTTTSGARRVFAVNAIAQLALAQLVLAHMPAGGAVVNVTSDAAVEAYEGWGAYGASKAALEQLSHVLAAERPDLRVYAVDPAT